MISCAQQVETLESQLASRMEQLQATVQSKTAVPTAQVYVNEIFCFETNLSTVLIILGNHESLACKIIRNYINFQPQFIHLSQIWSGFQDEMVLLSVLSNILVSLEPFTRVSTENYSI